MVRNIPSRHPQPSMEERLARHLESARALAESIDVMEIWDLAQGELDAAPWNGSRT
jgi:hypothetical protein